MTCINPISIVIKKGIRKGYAIEVPCGKCMNCRIQRTNEWKTRLLHEYWYNNSVGCFITLTYDDKYVPKYYSLKKRDLIKFQRDLRKFVKESKGILIKYYSCGEYGEETLRPHYHLLVLGWKPDKETLKKPYNLFKYYCSDVITRMWSKGNHTIGDVTEKSIQYVAGYVRKKRYGYEALERYDQYHCIPPFCLMSKGIGLEFAKENKKNLENGFIIKGENVGVPRYYNKKLGKKLYFKKDFDEKILKSIEKKVKRVRGDDKNSFSKQELANNVRLELDELSKQEKLRSGKI